MNILLAAATEKEISPTLEWLHAHWTAQGNQQFRNKDSTLTFCRTGVGLMHSTASLTRALLRNSFDFAIQAGVAGAYNRELCLGNTVLVKEEILGDLGAEDRDVFLDIYDLGLAEKNDAPFVNGRLPLKTAKHLPVSFRELKQVSGLSINTVSGKASTIAARSARWKADIETMEGAPFHFCCLEAGVPFAQLRAISNYVEPRNRDAWEMGKAVAALNETLVECLRQLSPPGI